MESVVISGFIDTYLRLNAQEKLLFRDQADRLLNRTEKGKVMELTTSWKEEGRQEGRQEGQAEMALRLLQHRFGPIPAAMKSKVRALSVPQLEVLGEALLDFSALSDLNRWLASGAQT